MTEDQHLMYGALQPFFRQGSASYRYVSSPPFTVSWDGLYPPHTLPAASNCLLQDRFLLFPLPTCTEAASITEKQGDASMKMLPQPHEGPSAPAEMGICIYYLPNPGLGNETVPAAQVV